MKKIFSILLILLIAFNAGGYYFIYNQLENHFKEIAFNKINDYIPLDQLEKIKIEKKSINYELEDKFERVDEKEIIYYGKMYDIYFEEKNQDTLIFYCINDEYEDIIHKAFAEYINEKDGNKNYKAISNIIKTLIITGLEPIQDIATLLPFNNEITYIKHLIFSDTKLDIPVPPPRFIAG